MEQHINIPINPHHQFQVMPAFASHRLDLYLAHQLPDYSRSFLAKLITSGSVLVNGRQAVKQATPVKVNDLVTVNFPIPEKKEHKVITQPLDVKIIFEHPHFFIVYKPAGLNVHAPSRAANSEVTLVDWLLANTDTPATVGYEDRPGIVHRLDKDTSGLMIIARTNIAHAEFNNLFKKRLIKKTYRAVVAGHPEAQGEIALPIGRHPANRKKMACMKIDSYRMEQISDELFFAPGVGKVRHAHTAYKVLEYFEDSALIEAYPTTGRTHQIRVHLAALGHPLIGDAMYGKRSALIARHALHAYALSFEFKGEKFEFCLDEAQDLKSLTAQLKPVV